MIQLFVFAPECPACRSESTHHEHADRHQCDKCGWRFVVQADGTVRDFISLDTAGKKRRSAAFDKSAMAEVTGGNFAKQEQMSESQLRDKLNTLLRWQSEAT